MVKVVVKLILFVTIAFSLVESVGVEEHGSVAKQEKEKLNDALNLNKTSFNFASFDSGAVVLSHSSGIEGAFSILTGRKDKYMMFQCDLPEKWFVIQLSEDIMIESIVISNLEHYSSNFKHVKIWGISSKRQSANSEDWILLGDFEAPNEKTFKKELKEAWVRYVKIEILSHYGNEYYCTITSVKVYGSTVLEQFHHDFQSSMSEMEKFNILEELNEIENGFENIIDTQTDLEYKSHDASDTYHDTSTHATDTTDNDNDKNQTSIVDNDQNSTIEIDTINSIDSIHGGIDGIDKSDTSDGSDTNTMDTIDMIDSNDSINAPMMQIIDTIDTIDTIDSDNDGDNDGSNDTTKSTKTIDKNDNNDNNDSNNNMINDNSNKNKSNDNSTVLTDTIATIANISSHEYNNTNDENLNVSKISKSKDFCYNPRQVLYSLEKSFQCFGTKNVTLKSNNTQVTNATASESIFTILTKKILGINRNLSMIIQKVSSIENRFSDVGMRIQKMELIDKSINETLSNYQSNNTILLNEMSRLCDMLDVLINDKMYQDDSYIMQTRTLLWINTIAFILFILTLYVFLPCVCITYYCCTNPSYKQKHQNINQHTNNIQISRLNQIENNTARMLHYISQSTDNNHTNAT